MLDPLKNRIQVQYPTGNIRPHYYCTMEAEIIILTDCFIICPIISASKCDELCKYVVEIAYVTK